MTQEKGSFWALLPIGVFVLLFAGSGLVFGDFYLIPPTLVFLIALFVALGQNDTEKALTTTDSTGYQAGVMRKNIGTASGNYFNDVSFDITLSSALTAGDYTLVIFAPGYYNNNNNNDKGFNYTTFTVKEGWEDLTISMGNLDLNTDLTDRSVKSTTVPEPTVLALLALGVAGVALRRWA